MTKSRNWIPAAIAFSPAVLLPLAQDVLRPRIHHSSPLGLLLASAPNLIVGFCFPFSILTRPSAWTRQTANVLFACWCAFTFAALVAVEYLSPFGQNFFDPRDLLASGLGVAMAVGLYTTTLRRRLDFSTASSTGEPELVQTP